MTTNSLRSISRFLHTFPSQNFPEFFRYRLRFGNGRSLEPLQKARTLVI